MDGERFVSHLKSLGVPGADALVGSNYDWLFLTEQGSPLATFFEWFCGNILSSDVLSENELKNYDAAVSRGEILTSHQLEEMEACFSCLPSLSNACQEEDQTNIISPIKRKGLELQLDILTRRKKSLSTHKMELREDVYSASESVKEAEAAFKNQQEAVINASRHLSESHRNLASSLDKLSEIFINFDKMTEEDARFISQLDLAEWHQEEAKFTEMLKGYIKKQFREGVKIVAGVEDSTEYCLLDTDNLDMHLVRGAGKLEYMQNVNELNRLDELLRQTEEGRLDGLILQARRQAEVEEANRLLSAIHRKKLPTALPMIQQQTTEALNSRMLLSHEMQQQHQILQSLVAEVAQLESTKTISGNYQLKCKRQEYFLEKQKIVMDQLISQLARHDWIKIALDVESDMISDILQVLKTINSVLSDEDNSYRERMSRMDRMIQEHSKEKATGQLPPPLVTLAQLPPLSNSQVGSESHHHDPPNGDNLLKQVKSLNKALTVAREQIYAARNPQFSRLSRMVMNCELLEIGLFGKAGSLKTLPFTWLDPKLVEKYTNLEQEEWKLTQKVLHLLSQYEEKKRLLLQIEPTLRKEMIQWTTDVVNALR
ncbi:LOW QUALITY PROTEIN: HAUS augmin-like complex subunit 3 [Macrobrachium nipponense]|uniref:LOW QUALITY PROTEIN: HAUS augmin-like complex subunit 3 n=1 Tax=Macrobrachium nipponense TaxID=159736 RepID=UPI0030C89D13